jgi:hypothetical protein
MDATAGANLLESTVSDQGLKDVSRGGAKPGHFDPSLQVSKSSKDALPRPNVVGDRLARLLRLPP